MNFKDTGLSEEIIKNLDAKGYKEPTPIQAESIPVILTGADVMAAAQTGTGKTAGFTLPILQLLMNAKKEGKAKLKNNQTKVLILAPTRELANQINDNVNEYKKDLGIKSVVVFGGVKINPQMQKLRGGTDILVATPGRLLDLHNQNAIRFNEVDFFVLDEADKMLDMGFIHDIKRVMKLLPKKRQNLLFSATFSDDVKKLAKQIVNNPKEISFAQKNTTVKSIEQLIHPVDKKSKSAALLELITTNNWHQVLVFMRTKHSANRLVKFLDKNKVSALAIHGNKSQGARTRALSEFKNNEIQVLVATDIAARGIDINELPHVVNFDLPNIAEDYIHRIGRTGRAGKSGLAVSLVCADEAKDLFEIERLIQRILPREYIDGFVPEHNLPESSLKKPRGAKKPKKNKPQQNNNRNNKPNLAKSKQNTVNRANRVRKSDG